jgi:hypothetical protein
MFSSAKTVERPMSKFQVGDYVKTGDIVGKVVMIPQYTNRDIGSDPVYSVSRLSDGYSFLCRESGMTLHDYTFCLICKQQIKIAKDLLVEHSFKDKICYGSFMPRWSHS